MHCRYQQKTDDMSDTLLISNRARKPVNKHPVSSLLNLIEKENLKADILLSPGDLGDKADQQGIISSWQFLEEIKNKLGSRLLFGVAGNHDIDSRNDDNQDPFEFIKNFADAFPIQDETLKTQFWEKGCCTFQFETVQFFLLNSVHDHFNKEKAKQSNITELIAEQISNCLDLFKPEPETEIKYKIAVLHHHPIQHTDITNFDKNQDLLNKGDRFITILNKYDFQIIIHGHKHQPRVTEQNSMTIFASGSFASIANIQASGFNTMFHILELNEIEKKGFIYSWEFDLLNGWRPKLNENFPPKIGFGSSKSIEAIAREINTIFQNNGNKTMLFQNIIEKEIDVQYLIPEKLIGLNKLLNMQYKLKTNPDFPLEPNIISKIL
jgi:predicted phosphodiesterase